MISFLSKALVMAGFGSDEAHLPLHSPLGGECVMNAERRSN